MAGLRESVTAFQGEVSDVTSRDVLSLMLLVQYFDTLKEVGTSGNSSTIFIPSDPGAVGSMSSQIRDGVLAAQAMRR